MAYNAPPNNIVFTCTKLDGTNKVGTLKKNANGYYTMVIGALNMFNSAGMYYDFKAAEQFFMGNSALMRRVNNGALRGENGHPRREPGMSVQAYYARLLQIHEDKTVCHFASITLNFNDYKDDQGRPIVAIVAEVCPSGPFGHVLEKQLQNPQENVCFSIRSFTDDKLEGRIIVRRIKTIVTFDYVNEPGMSVANKFLASNPALEALEDLKISRAEVEAGTRMLAGTVSVGNESEVMTCEELYSSMGWESPTAIKAPVGSPWSKW